MAATFVVEDGQGLATANAYATVAFCDQYHENYGNPTDWSGSSTSQKQEAIRIATRYIDGSYHGRWIGFRKTRDQALDHPRMELVDTDDWLRDADLVAQEVQEATAILALKSRQGEIFLPDVTGEDQGVTGERVKVGPIEEEKKFAGTKTTFKKFSLVTSVLRPLLQRTGTRDRA